MSLSLGIRRELYTDKYSVERSTVINAAPDFSRNQIVQAGQSTTALPRGLLSELLRAGV